jgi:endo-1,4-beta-xylanase
MMITEESARIERELNAAIRKNRVVKAQVSLSSGGKPLANREVVVEQVSHRFIFGANWGNSAIALANDALAGRELVSAESRNARFLEVFNQVTLPFYWATFELERGAPKTEMIMKTALWYSKRGVACKGHPLCWHTLTAPWLLGMDDDSILKEQLGRIRRDVADFKGVVDAWDVVNEAVIMPVFDKYDNGITRLCKKLGRVGLVKAMFDQTRATNPGATLLLNDFDTSADYAALVRDCLEAGIKIDALGVQSHMHQGWWGVEKLQKVLERFRGFGLPIHFTENTILSGDLMPPKFEDLNDYKVYYWPSTMDGEDRQAREVVLHYKTLVADPSVAAITWWDLSDGGWLGAPAGLLRRDHSPKPAFEALKRLVKDEWWLAQTTMRADGQGRISIEGFEGDYRVECDGKDASFPVARDGASVSIEL